MVAVQCPRFNGEALAELLIELGLDPWRSKSSSTPRGVTGDALTRRVRTLITELSHLPVTWHAVAGWGRHNKEQRGAIACIVASKALTGGAEGDEPEYEGPAVLLHDGGDGLYGRRQVTFRQYATRQFSGFSDRVTPVYLSHLQDGDRTYPEITTADYLAGYLRNEISDKGIDGVDCVVQRIDKSWRASNETPITLYELRTRNRHRRQTKEERVAAWIEGRRPSLDGAWNEQPLESLVGRLKSERVRQYILEEL